jgi:outer membrane protein assembly factor BamB
MTRASEIVDWPRFRGPNGSGVSKVRNLPVEFGPSTNRSWKVPTPAGSSSPVAVNDRVFVTGYDGDERLTICFDLRNGRRVWEQKLHAARSDRKTKPNDPASSTPATDGANLYVFFSEFGLLAYSMQGEEVWRKALGPFSAPHGMASSPIVVHGNVVLLVDQVSGSHIVAFDAASGTQKWRTVRGDFVGGYTTPILVQNDIVVSGPIEMIGYSAQTGEARWSVPRMGVMPISSPVSDGHRIFAHNDAVPPFESLSRELKGDRNGDEKLTPEEFPDPSFKEAVLALDRNYGDGDGAVNRQEWDGALRLLTTMNSFVAVNVDNSEPREMWRTTKILANAASPLLYLNVLYLVRNGAILTSVNPENGEVFKQERVAGMENPIFASPVAGAGKIYIVNESGKIGVIEAGPDWRVLKINDLQEKCYATPALLDGTILVRGEYSLSSFRNNLNAFENKNRK